jgi:hypothetical protein
MLFEPGDKVSLVLVRAERVLPGDIYWGRSRPGGELSIWAQGTPVPLGAVPDEDGRVHLAGISVDGNALVLIEDTRPGKR